MIVDASVLLRAFLPDEHQPSALALIRDHISDQLTLKAPALLPYEIENAVWQAERRGRITQEQADTLIASFANLEIAIIPQVWGELLPMARRYNRSAYDAAYLALAESLNEQFITADAHLYNAVHTYLDYVIWLGENDS